MTDLTPDELSAEEPQFIDEEELEVRPKTVPRPVPPPAPREQSGFVNPAMARIVAARPREDGHEPGEVWLGLRTLLIVIAAAVISSFIFNYWMPDTLLSQKFTVELQAVSSTQGPPTIVPSPLPTVASQEVIGIIVGHSGPPLNQEFEVDPGAICDENFDGVPELTELEINTEVGQKVANLLVEQGYGVEMLNEWDTRRNPGYRATVLISIHTNTCHNFNDIGATGFNVEGNTTNPVVMDRDARLAECIAATYANATGLPRHFGRPPDLVDYHAFEEISVDTPIALVELGFMFADRQVLVDRRDDMARGIVDGVQCYLRPNQFIPTQPPPTLETQAGT